MARDDYQRRISNQKTEPVVGRTAGPLLLLDRVKFFWVCGQIRHEQTHLVHRSQRVAIFCPPAATAQRTQSTKQHAVHKQHEYTLTTGCTQQGPSPSHKMLTQCLHASTLCPQAAADMPSHNKETASDSPCRNFMSSALPMSPYTRFCSSSPSSVSMRPFMAFFSSLHTHSLPAPHACCSICFPCAYTPHMQAAPSVLDLKGFNLWLPW